MKFLTLALPLVVLALSSCANLPWSEKAPTHQVHLMTYNVENLFDTQHDQGKDDYAYLPLTVKKSKTHQKICGEIKVPRWKEECLSKDWNETVLKEKMSRLSEVVLQVNEGEGPDLIFLQEVENKTVLEQWNEGHLKSAYKEVLLIEGEDKRGIDVAILSKLPLKKAPLLHKIPLTLEDPTKVKDTRGILEAHFSLPDGATLVTFAVHFPSPGNPQPLRAQALAFLNKLTEPYQTESMRKDHFVVVAGDFNIPLAEDKEHKMTESQKDSWLVSHVEGCKDCKGTYYFKPKDEWSFLDWMMFSKNLDRKSKSWKLNKKSIRLVDGLGFQKSEEGKPLGFDASKGVSDHFPMTAIIQK